MTALAQHYPQHHTPIKGIIILVAMLGVLGGIRTAAHATERHGATADHIRRCLEANGADRIYSDPSRPDVFAFCVNMDEASECGFWGVLIAKLLPGKGCRYQEKTSFSPGNSQGKGKLARLERYFSEWERVR